MVGRSFHSPGYGQGSLPEVRMWLGNTSGGPEVVGALSRRSGTGRKTLPEVRNWSGDSFGGPEEVGTSS